MQSLAREATQSKACSPSHVLRGLNPFLSVPDSRVDGFDTALLLDAQAVDRTAVRGARVWEVAEALAP